MTYLGIDGGGTAVRWALVGRDGAPVDRGEAAPVTGHLFLDEARTGFEHFAGELAALLVDRRVGGIFAGITGLTGDSPEAAAAVRLDRWLCPATAGAASRLRPATSRCSRW